MLKEKTYNSGDIVTVYLQTGQEILGKFVSEDDSSTVLTKPLTVAIGPKLTQYHHTHHVRQNNADLGAIT